MRRNIFKILQPLGVAVCGAVACEKLVGPTWPEIKANVTDLSWKIVHQNPSTRFPPVSSPNTMVSKLFPTRVWCQDSTSERKLFKLPQASEISPKQILEHSVNVTAGATLQLVQLTTAAILSASDAYKKAMEAEMLLLNKSLDFVNVQFMQEDFNDAIIKARSDIAQCHCDLKELLGFMDYVEKQANCAAETSFLVGAEYSSLTLSEVLAAALKQVLQQKVDVALMEAEVRELQQQVILRSKPAEKPTELEQNSEED